MGEEGKIVLYSYWRSSCSWRVRLALAWKQLKYHYKAVHLVKNGGEQLTTEFATKINEQKSVPALLIDGKLLTQSLSIMEYLEETRPNQPILPPKDKPYERALVRKIALAVASDIQPIQNLRVLKYVGLEKKVEWGAHWIQVGFQSLEQIVSKTAGKYSVGDSVTLADFCIIPQIYNARRFKVDMSQFPTLSSIYDNLSKLPFFKQAHPDSQPDALLSN